MSEAGIIQQLVRLLPSQCVLSSGEELRPYECDGLSAYRNLPLSVVIPETREQVRDILRLCAANGVPVVARGAGTGLSGGALPVSGGVLLSMARFNRILGIDTQNRTARVQPGVTNLSISRAAEPHVSIMPRTPPRNSPVPSAAMSPKMPAACIA